MKMPNIFDELEGKEKGKTNTRQQKAKLFRNVVFFGKIVVLFYYNDVIINLRLSFSTPEERT